MAGQPPWSEAAIRLSNAAGLRSLQLLRHLRLAQDFERGLQIGLRTVNHLMLSLG